MCAWHKQRNCINRTQSKLNDDCFWFFRGQIWAIAIVRRCLGHVFSKSSSMWTHPTLDGEPGAQKVHWSVKFDEMWRSAHVTLYECVFACVGAYTDCNCNSLLFFISSRFFCSRYSGIVRKILIQSEIKVKSSFFKYNQLIYKYLLQVHFIQKNTCKYKIETYFFFLMRRFRL